MTVNLSSLGGAGQQFFSDSGVPLNGGKLYSYAAGTTTPQTCYTTSAGNVAHTNPIILNSAGRVSSGEIWLTAGSNYKFVLTDSSDVLIATWDNLYGISGVTLPISAANVTYTPPFSGGVAKTVEDEFALTINLKDFATGSGSDEYTAIMSALAAATGKALCVPAGYTFASATRIQIPSNIRIYGGGTLKALALGTSASIQGFLYGDSLTNVTIDGITIDCNPSVQTHPLLTAVYFTASSKVKLTNNKVTCSYAGLYVRTNSSYVEVSNNYIDNSYGSSSDAALRHGASIIVGANNGVVSGNIVKGIVSTAVIDSDIATGVYVGTESAITYNNLSVVNNTVQYSYSAIAASYANNVSIVGNTVSDCRTKNHSQGIILTSCQGATVDSNSIRNIDYTAIALVNCKSSTVSNNTITNDSSYLIGAGSLGGLIANGITVSQSSNGLSANNVVSGNSIVVSGVTPNASYYSLLVYGDGSLVTNNSVQATLPTAAFGIAFTGTRCVISDNSLNVSYHALYTFDVAGWTTCQYNVIENNSINTTGTYAILDQSTGPSRYMTNHVFSGTTLYSNAQYITNGNLQQTLLNKTADYTITAQDTNKWITNGGAGGLVTFSLPSATGSGSYIPYGLSYTFTNISFQTFHIEPVGTEIIGTGNAGKYAILSNGGTVQLTCLTSGYWTITSVNGTVTYEP